MAGLALMCGFYLNELLLKLVAREDPHEELYGAYEQALSSLRDGQAPAAVLRRFEHWMLAELGYALRLNEDVGGAVLEPTATYAYVVERGAVRKEPSGPTATPPAAEVGLEVIGKTLLDMDKGDYSDPATVLQSRALMRYVINHYLGDQTLHTRQLLRDLQQL
jgi:DNA repair protein RecO (recombination protein O)